METTYTHYRKTARVRIIVAALLSFMLHAGLVGFAALSPNFGKRPDPLPEPEVLEETNMELPPPELVVPEDYNPEEPTPDEPTPPEEETPEPEDTPPPVEDMTFVDPTPEPTPEKAKAAARKPPPGIVVTAQTKRGPVYIPGVDGGKPGGTPGGKVGGQGWVTPKPPYPGAAKQMRAQGETTVSIRTGADGRVIDVSITKSAGAILDGNTKSYVRNSWKGPPNSQKTTTFVYQLR